MQYWLDSGAVDAEERAGGEVATALFGAARGCDEFEQRILRFGGAGGDRRDDDRDEALYVLAGSGAVTIDRELYELAPGTAVYVARGTAWRVERAEGLTVLSVLVNDPAPAGGTHAVLSWGERGQATAGRQFTLLATPEHGCASVTQFVGFIPVVRAPDHYHEYDEVVYVLAGEGLLHIDGESRPLHPGACVHLPRRLVHCLENTGPGEMQVLGVFRPAGSPAEAYYPNGTKAVY